MERKNLLSVRLAYFLGAAGILWLGSLVTALTASWGRKQLWVLLVLLLLTGVLLVMAYFYIWKPYSSTTKQLGIFASKPLKKEMYQIQWPYNRQMQQAVERLQEYMEASTTLEMSKRQAQYQALQNQINPHFLYNTLESIRSEALIAGLDSVAEMCEALASFFRYTISNMENLVTVEQEI